MDRMTHERVNGLKTGYWSPEKKEELVQRLAAYENTGLEPRQVHELLRKLQLKSCEDIKPVSKEFLAECRDVVKKYEKKSDRWIPVEKDNIPTGEVLACNRYGEMMIGYLAYMEGSNTEFNCESTECLMWDVIAWRPLPEPYRPDR